MLFIRINDERYETADGTWQVTRGLFTRRWGALHMPHDSNRASVSILATIPSYATADEAIAAVRAGKYPTR